MSRPCGARSPADLAGGCGLVAAVSWLRRLVTDRRELSRFLVHETTVGDDFRLVLGATSVLPGFAQGATAS